LFPVPESNWMGDFAVSLAIAYQIGAARGDYSIFSAMDVQEEELFASFGQSINELILGHRKHLERKREARSAALKINARWLEATSTAVGPKGRWVDGTPEYSFYISALRKLFPSALFVHLVRDVQAVVHSMLNFHRVGGIQLVPNQQEAYHYWLRAVSACLQAERAYGPNVVYRVRYKELIDNPESAMHSLLTFLEEPYALKCIEPLKERINSSTVPADFKADDTATDPAIVEEAQRLSADIEENAQPGEGSPDAARQIDVEFGERVKYIATLERTYRVEKSRLESVISAYQAENLRLESAIVELQRQFKDSCSRFAQANDQTLQ
jgi:hypothetical protein